MSKLDSLDLASFGVTELSVADATAITGGGFWSNVFRSLTDPAGALVNLIQDVVWDMFHNPRETWNSAVDGFRTTSVVP